MSNRPKLIVIVGPTASGKSDLAVFLAKKFNGEIVSADSRQVYKYMNIGTGKVTKKEMGGIPHHLLDVVHPSHQFTVVDFQKKALAAIKKIQKNNKLPILVGGTGFYVQAITDGIVYPEIPANKKLRAQLELLSVDDLFKKLQKKDPRRAANIDTKNKRRLIRALEIITKTGKPVALREVKESEFDILMLGVEVSKKTLDKKIELRLKKRILSGMIKEIKDLHEKRKVSWKRLEGFGLEYKWVSKYLQNRTSRGEMEENLYRDIKNYAKRQMTWFSKDKRIKWIKTWKQAEMATKKFVK